MGRGNPSHLDKVGTPAKDVFVLDREENPHPRMREHALQMRRVARLLAPGAMAAIPPEVVEAIKWLGYTDCACDATGWNAETWNAWLDSHDDFDPALIGHKEATAPPAVAQRVAMPRRLGGPKDRAR